MYSQSVTHFTFTIDFDTPFRKYTREQLIVNSQIDVYF